MVEAASMDNRRPNDAKRKPGSPQKKAPPPPPPGLAPRRAALDILTLVAAGRTLDQALEDCRTFNALEGPDRGLAHALVAAVLRRRGSIDQLIGRYIDRPIPKRSARATDVLRLSAAQSLFLKTPDHAVVSTAVALVQEFRETAGYSGLINAVARKIAADGAEALARLPERIDTPGWMWRGWERSFGAESARAIARAHQSEAPIDLTPREAEAAGRIAIDTGGVVLPTGSIRVPAGSRVTKLPGFDAGAWWVQDAAAALPARLLGDVRGKLVFDLCAAPGGKTMQLAAAGAEVVAVDHEGARLKTVAENLARTGLVAETIKADILDWTPTRLADAILLDAFVAARAGIGVVLIDRDEASAGKGRATIAGILDDVCGVIQRNSGHITDLRSVDVAGHFAMLVLVRITAAAEQAIRLGEVVMAEATGLARTRVERRMAPLRARLEALTAQVGAARQQGMALADAPTTVDAIRPAAEAYWTAQERKSLQLAAATGTTRGVVGPLFDRLCKDVLQARTARELFTLQQASLILSELAGQNSWFVFKQYSHVAIGSSYAPRELTWAIMFWMEAPKDHATYITRLGLYARSPVTRSREWQRQWYAPPLELLTQYTSKHFSTDHAAHAAFLRRVIAELPDGKDKTDIQQRLAAIEQALR